MTILPLVFNTAFELIQHPIRRHSSKDLAEITDLAEDRKRLWGVTSQIKKAAEESQPKNCYDGEIVKSISSLKTT